MRISEESQKKQAPPKKTACSSSFRRLWLRPFTIDCCLHASFSCNRKIRPKNKAREVMAASELATQEAAQQRADGAMKAVVKAQDRLIVALQTELGMISRARETAEVRDFCTFFSVGWPKQPKPCGKMHGRGREIWRDL